jgi:hypothetical protein
LKDVSEVIRNRKPRTNEQPLFDETEDPLFDETDPALPAVTERAEPGVRVLNENIVLHAGAAPVTRLKLAQPTSAEGTAGKFYNSDTTEELDEILFVPLRIQAIRTLWPEASFSRGRQPECASLDGVFAVERFPDGSLPLFPGHPCSRCEYFTTKPWAAGPGERICSPGYDVFGLSLDSYEVISLRLQGSSAKIARLLARPGVFQRQIVRLYSKKQTTDKGSWFQMFGEACGAVTPEQAQEVRAIMAEFRPLTVN